MDDSLLKYGVCNKQALGCGEFSYYDTITLQSSYKLFKFFLFVKCLQYLAIKFIYFCIDDFFNILVLLLTYLP
jgi:hypothetical protein